MKNLDQMLRAVGSSKPWVRRHLRTWHVSYKPGDGVQMSWYGGVHRCFEDHRPSKTSRSRQCRREAVRLCTERMVPIWQALLCVIGEQGASGHITAETVEVTFGEHKVLIPTDLVIESMRLFMRGEHAATCSTLYSKRCRRRMRRSRNSERRSRAKRNGRHTRWTEEATR